MKEKVEMDPVKVKRFTGIYGAPRGMEDRIGGLPYWREKDQSGSTVYSAWKPSEDEIKCLQLGGTVILDIHGMEPIPPVSIGVAWRGRNEDDTPNPAGDDPRALIVTPERDEHGRQFVDPAANNEAE